MIRNKDGTIYRLQEPNPLVKDQEWTKDTLLELENFNWEEELVKDITGKVKIPKVIEEPQESQEPQNVQPLIVETPVPPPLPKSDSSSNIGINEENIVIMHCLPAIVQTNKDEFYNDSYSRVIYGKKFMLESVMVERGDLGIRFWTKTKLESNSIVYPSVYKTGIKYGEYRWWKVMSSVPKSGGYLVEAIFSDVQPEFSSS
jgi:hypothetical protein